MKCLALLIAFFFKSAFGMTAGYRRMDHRQPTTAVTVRHGDVEEFRKLVTSDLASKADELIDLIVADIEKMLNEQNAHPSFIQNSIKENTKLVIKNGVITITKHLLPLFEKWIAEAVRPPVTTPMVYSALVKPIAKSVFSQLGMKLHLPESHAWDTEGEDELELGLIDGEEAAEIEA